MRTELTQLQIIKEFAVSLLSQNSLDDFLWDMAANIGKLLNYEDCVIYLNIDGVLEQYAAYGIKNPSRREIVDRIQISVGQGIVGTVAATGIPELIKLTTEDPRYIPDLFCGQSELTVPIVSEGKVIGVIDSENKSPNAYTSEDVEILQALANIAASRIAAAISREEIVRVRGEGAQYKLLLETEREWSRTVLDSIQDGIIATDAESTVVMTSPMAVQLLGWAPEAAIGQSITHVFAVEDSSDLTSIPLTKIVDCEADLRLKDGSVRRISYRTSPIHHHNELVGRVIVFRDIEREQYLEREAEKAQRLESLGVLAGGIAHDFNNNIQTVVASLHTLKEVSGETGARMIDTAEKACLQSKELASQLLTFSKGGEPLMQPTDTENLIRRSVELAMAGRNSFVEILFSKPIANLFVDEAQIEQVIGNIVLNADQAMASGGQIIVHARNSMLPTQPTVECVEISIADLGDGIEEQAIGRIFDPYFSTKSAGNGLGLTISYSIVKRHGGEIVVESEMGRGTVFKIYLPMTNSPFIEGDGIVDSTSSTSFKILLLDDDDLVLQATAAILSQYGHRVESVSNREEAITVFSQHFESQSPFDLAILDLTIRGDVGGQEIGRQLKQIDPNLKMVVASGYASGPVLSNFRDYGFCAVLEKPFDGRSLSNVVQKAFED